MMSHDRFKAATLRVVSVTTSEMPTAPDLGVWRRFLYAHTSVMRTLEAELVGATGLPLASFDVLVHLGEAPGGRLRMGDLADRILLSRSGASRLVDRLVRLGLVERQACPGDGRGMYAVLTLAGRERLQEAAPVHQRGVGEHFTARLPGDHLTLLDDLLAELVAKD